jgi:predicted nucleic acid-binding protein
MGRRFLFDTNTVIYIINKTMPLEAFRMLSSIQTVHLSVISEIELLGWQAPNPTDELLYQAFVTKSVLIEMDRAIIEKAIEIRKIYKIKTPDAIIAATALVHNLTLVSRNDTDFQRIKKLKYTNPFNL